MKIGCAGNQKRPGVRANAGPFVQFRSAGGGTDQLLLSVLGGSQSVDQFEQLWIAAGH